MAEHEDKATGTGLLFPFVREAGDFANGSGIPLLKSNVRKAIAVKSSSPDGRVQGEYPWRLDFGSQVYRLRHTNLDTGSRDDLTKIYVVDAVGKWEPRARAEASRTVIRGVKGGRATRISVKFRPDTAQSDNVVRDENVDVEVPVG